MVKLLTKLVNIILAGGSVILATAAFAASTLTLERAVLRAQQNDPWQQAAQFREQAAMDRSEAAGQLPDPSMSLELANLPTDSFDFNQEAMSQFKLGLHQQFPRGASRKLKQQQLRQLGQQIPALADERRATVAVTVAQLWLEAYRQQKTIQRIEKDRSLFVYLVEVAQSSYANALGKTRQQDMVRAQLELTRLDDRLINLQQMQNSYLAQLQEWMNTSEAIWNFKIANHLPKLTVLDEEVIKNAELVIPYLQKHPSVTALEFQISASRSAVELAQQQYKPQWGISGSYAVRENDPLGNKRADFFSVGINLDLPLFTRHRQDKQVAASTAESEAIKTEKALHLRKLRAQFESALAQFLGLRQRQELYRTRLLSEMHEQAEAALTAYTNSNGDFAEVVRARIAELNTHIDALNIAVDSLKTVVQLNYFLVASGADKNLAILGVAQ